MNQIEREIENLENQLDNGEITSREYCKYMKELQLDIRTAAEEAAEEAYREEMSRW